MPQQKLDERPDQADKPDNSGDGFNPDKNYINRGLSDLQNYANSSSEQNSTNDADAGKSLYRRSSSENRGLNKTTSIDIGDAERNASSSDGLKTTSNSREKGFYTSSPSGKRGKKKTTRISRNKKIGIGFGGAGIVTAIVVLMGVVQGPLALVQFSQLLQRWNFFSNESFGDDRTSKITTLYRYSRTSTLQGTRLGTISGKYADILDARMLENSGVRILYDTGTGRMSALEVLDEDKAKSLIKNLESDGIDTSDTRDTTFLNTGRTADQAADEIRGRVVFIDANSKTRRSVIRSVVDSLDLNKISSAVGSRTLIKLGGVTYKPIGDIVRDRADSTIDYHRKKQVAREEIIRNGELPIDTPEPEARAAPDGDPDVIDENARAVAIDTKAEIDGLVGEAKTPINEGGVLKKASSVRLSFAGKLAGGAAAAVGVLCVVRDVGEQAETLQYVNTMLPMMRIGIEFIAVGSQIQSGENLNLDEMSYYSSLLFDEETGLGHMTAASIQSEMDQPITGPDLDPAVKPDRISNRPLLFEIIDGIPGIGTACGIDDRIGDIPVLGQAVDFVDGLQTGAINLFLAGFGTSIEGITGSVVAWLAGEAVDQITPGPNQGNLANYGGRMAAGQQALATGGRPLTDLEVAELDEQKQQIIAYENQQKSFYDRYLNVAEIDSLAFNATNQAPKSASQTLARLIQAPTVLASAIFPKASAQSSSEYDYGFDEVGFSVGERNSDLVADPYENARYVEENGLIERFNGCFPAQIDPQTGVLSLESFTDENAINQFNIDPSCTEPGSINPELLRYRVYLSDMISAKSIACYEGDETSCGEIGFNGGGSSNTASDGSTSLNAPGLNGYAVPCTGQPTPVVRVNTPGSEHSDWSQLATSGVIGTDSSGNPINVYIREACDTSNPKTILIVSSVHGSENGGQFVGHELLYNRALPADVRIIVVPEVNKTGIIDRDGGGVVRGGVNNYGRVNANAVNLNRNNDYRWSDMNRIENTSTTGPDADNYRGPAANSEPETRALQSFIQSLGDINLTVHYHDNLFYVAPVGSTNPQFASVYAAASGMHGQCPGTGANPSTRNCAIVAVNQMGSLDGWQAATTGDPVLLIELSSDLSDATMQRNVDGIMAIINGGLL